MFPNLGVPQDKKWWGTSNRMLHTIQKKPASLLLETAELMEQVCQCASAHIRMC